MAHTLCMAAVYLAIPATSSTTYSPTIKRDKEVKLQFGKYEENAPPVCNSTPINLQYSTDNCLMLDKDWEIWEKINFTLPVSILMKLDCGPSTLSYKVYVDCEGVTDAATKLACTFLGGRDCGGKTVIDASTFLTFPTDPVDGECDNQCIELPEQFGKENAGKYCLNMRVDYCRDLTPAPDTPSPAPAPDWPEPPPGLYLATVKLGLEETPDECANNKVFQTPTFHNGDCIDIVNTSGVQVPSALSDFGLTFSVKFTCHPTVNGVSYSTHTTADCSDSFEKLPSGWANFGDCVKRDMLIVPGSLITGVPDQGVAVRVPLYMEIDSCSAGTASPTAPSLSPSYSPSVSSTSSPTPPVTNSPSAGPSITVATDNPSISPTQPPTITGHTHSPTASPTISTAQPTTAPTHGPNVPPTRGPSAPGDTHSPSVPSTSGPSASPTHGPLTPGHTKSPKISGATPQAPVGPAGRKDGEKSGISTINLLLLIVGIIAILLGLGLVAHSYYPRTGGRRQGTEEPQAFGNTRTTGGEEMGTGERKHTDYDMIAD